MSDRSRELSLVITEVSLMPDILGFSMVKTLLYTLLCVIAVGVAGTINAGLIAWVLVIEFVLTVVLVSITIATPSHLTLVDYFGHKLRQRYGQRIIRHDSFADREYSELDTHSDLQDNE